MGKLNIDLLKGVEEQENVIGKSNTKDKPQTSQKQKSDSEQPKAIKITPEEKKTESQINAKPQKQSFSFRADLQKIEHWKLYAETIGTDDIGALWTIAIDEYIENHRLTPEQQTVYGLKKQALEAQKKIMGK